jgi:hydrogenase expression/formation protein HypD
MRSVPDRCEPTSAAELLSLLKRQVTRPWTVMEVCGGQTHTLLREGIDQLLPTGLRLVHGPGCPVCVTPLEVIDQAIALASNQHVIVCSFGDMLRVPGSVDDLLGARAAGCDVRVVYSPLDAVHLAETNPDRVVAFLGVGFETTAPTTALAVRHAARLGLTNFVLMSAHVLVPPAMEAILDSPDGRVQGFLAPGHVCTVMGWTQYEPIAERFEVPIIVTGFDPIDLLEGLVMLVAQLEAGDHRVENQYVRSACRLGNRFAQDVLDDVFEICDRPWRGIGTLHHSGLRLRADYRDFDALERFPALRCVSPEEPSVCIAGRVLRGLARPNECEAFGTACTPEHPLGAPMISSEGACAAYHLAGRFCTPVRQQPAPS